MNNENQNKLDELQNEGFKPLSEEDEKQISGGISIKFNCPFGQCWSDYQRKCIPTTGNPGCDSTGGG